MSNRLLAITLALATFTVGADEFVLGPLLTPIGTALQTEPAHVAWLITAFALPYAVLAPVFGILSDRIGRRRVLLPGLTVFIVATAGTAIASDMPTALMTRLVTGIAAAAVTPNVFAVAGDLSTDAERAGAMGRVQLGLTLGLITSPALGAWLAAAVSWRAAFWLIAFIGTVALIAIARTLPTDRGNGETTQAGDGAVLPVLRRPGAIAAVTTMMLGLGVAVGTYAMIGEILRERYDLGTASVGALMALFGLFTVVGNLLVGPMTRTLGDVPRTIAVGMAGTSLGIGGVTLADPLPLAGFLGAAGCWLIAGGFAAPALQTHLAELGGRQRATLLALGSSGLNLGIMLMTAVEGWLYAAYGRVSVGVVAVVAVAAAVGLIVLTRARYPEPAPAES